MFLFCLNYTPRIEIGRIWINVTLHVFTTARGSQKTTNSESQANQTDIDRRGDTRRTLLHAISATKLH